MARIVSEILSEREIHQTTKRTETNAVAEASDIDIDIEDPVPHVVHSTRRRLTGVSIVFRTKVSDRTL